MSTIGWLLLAVAVGALVGAEAYAWMRHGTSLVIAVVSSVVVLIIVLSISYGMMSGFTGWDPLGWDDGQPAATNGGHCDPNYTGACLSPDASDYDCAGGTGDGPKYVGPVQVIGSDVYGLDRDGDGYACE